MVLWRLCNQNTTKEKVMSELACSDYFLDVKRSVLTTPTGKPVGFYMLDLENEFFWEGYRQETFFEQMVWADLVPMNEFDEFSRLVKEAGGKVCKEEIFDEDDFNPSPR